MPTQRLNGIQLHYEIAGEGEPLVFIHGLGGSLEDWEFQVPHFAKRFRVITLDLRGHGRSEKPHGPYSMRLFASDIVALLNTLRIGSAHIVGLSLGGGVAFQLAVDAPELVKTLTIVNSGPELTLRTLKEKSAIWLRFAILRLFGLPKMSEVIAGRLFPRPEHAQLARDFVARFARNDRRAYEASLRAFVGWSVVDQLGELRCPTLVMTADHDYSPVSVKEAYAGKIAGAKLVVIPDSHHAAPVERPEAFNRMLEEFLSDREQPEAIRIISAWKATGPARNRYEQQRP